MNETDNFFTDYHGIQQLKDNPIVNLSIAEWEYERLKNIFKYAYDIERAEGLIYLNYLHSIIKKQVVSKIGEDIPIENVICNVLTGVIKLYKERHVIDKKVFARLPQSHLVKIEKALDNVIEQLPNNFYDHLSRYILGEYIEYDPSKGMKPVDSVFYIPLKEQFPELEKCLEKSKQDDISFLYTKPKELNSKMKRNDDCAYPLETMFECYRDSIPSYNYRDFKAIVHTELNSSRSDDELMEFLLETFGYGTIDFITEIIRHRHKKIDYSSSVYENGSHTGKKKPSELIAGQVTVQSEKESILSKKLRKMEKKDKIKFSSIDIKQTEAEYEVAKNTPIFKKTALQRLDPEEYPHVHDQLRNHMITTKYDGVSITQPENAIKKVTPDYAEFTIPGGKKGDVPDMKLVKVSSLDATGQLVFRDIKEFNRIQSEVFSVAYHSNENMLVCAPTGAGKTNIALLAIVHQIRCHMDGSLIRKNDFKIIYVCPMKALATEMVSNFSKKLAPIGISVKECTGDMQLTKKEIAETQMLVTTPEKWDVITRKGAAPNQV